MTQDEHDRVKSCLKITKSIYDKTPYCTPKKDRLKEVLDKLEGLLTEPIHKIEKPNDYYPLYSNPFLTEEEICASSKQPDN